MYVEKTKTFGVVLLAQLMRRYVMYHVKLLTEIGQSCFPANEKDSSYIRDTDARFIQNVTNCRKAISMLSLLGPTYLFSTGDDPESISLRQTADILHLFVCLFEYRECFGDQLNQLIQELVIKTGLPHNVRGLTWILNLIILVQSKDWLKLELILSCQQAVPDMTCLPKELTFFCSAIKNLAHGLVLCYHSKYKENRSKDVLDKRMEYLDSSLKQFASEGFTANSEMARKYFTVHVRFAKAEAAWIKKRKRIENIKAAVSVCRETKKCVRQVPILLPL